MQIKTEDTSCDSNKTLQKSVTSYSRLPVIRTGTYSKFPLIRSNFHFPWFFLNKPL